MAAEVEEIVFDADALAFQEFNPDRGDSRFSRRPRRDAAFVEFRAAAIGRGNAARSILPLAINGIA